MSVAWYITFMTQLSSGDWLLLKDAAKVIGVEPSVLSRYAQAGRIPHERVGRQVMILRSEAEKFRDTPRPVGRPKKKKR